MKKFVARLALLAVIMLLVICLMHVAAIWMLQDELKSAYTVDPSTEVLFLGSSQVGCSIFEDTRYHLKKLWVSDTITPSCLMRLRELELRGQLSHLKVVVVPFNIHSITALSERGYLWGWYQELPISWRYMDILPYSKARFAWYILCNLRFPFLMHLSDKPPERDGLASSTETYRKKVLVQYQGAAQKVQAQGSSPDWERCLFDAYREMSEICKRHGICFIVYKAPLLPDYERNLSTETQHQIAVYEKRLSDIGLMYIKPQIELDDKYFFDNVHLIKSGADIFTAELFRLMGLVVPRH